MQIGEMFDRIRLAASLSPLFWISPGLSGLVLLSFVTGISNLGGGDPTLGRRPN